MSTRPAAAPGPTALTIAGFDPGSGAGITADLLVFARFGIFATSAIAALTVQSTRGVRRTQSVDPGLLAETLAELEADLPPAGIKIGMLGAGPQVRVVTEYLKAVRARRRLTVVLDPVIASSSGARLLDDAGLDLLRSDLLPRVDVVTPNLAEASLLTGLPCGTVQEAEHCAAELAAHWPNLIPVITGGHLSPPSDLIFQDAQPTWLAGERINSRATHGTGCAFSSALLAGRLQGDNWVQAAEGAKRFVSAAIRSAVPRGAGRGPLHLLGGNVPDRDTDVAHPAA